MQSWRRKYLPKTASKKAHRINVDIYERGRKSGLLPSDSPWATPPDTIQKGWVWPMTGMSRLDRPPLRVKWVTLPPKLCEPCWFWKETRRKYQQKFSLWCLNRHVADTISLKKIKSMVLLQVFKKWFIFIKKRLFPSNATSLGRKIY